MKIKKINIGQEIRKLVGERYGNYAAFARKIGKSRQCVQTQIFSKQSLHTDLLIRISEELGINLFELYQNEDSNVTQKNDKSKIALNVQFETTREELMQLGIYDTLEEMVRNKLSE